MGPRPTPPPDKSAHPEPPTRTQGDPARVPFHPQTGSRRRTLRGAPPRRPGGDRVGRAETPGPALGREARPGACPARPDPRTVLLRHARPVRRRRHIQQPRRAHRFAPGDRVRPHGQGLLPGRRPQGPDNAARLHQGPRHHRHLARPDLQEPCRPGHRQGRLGRLPRLLDHRLHPGRPALRDQRRPGEADRQGPRQGHEGLLRRHHQPHRRHRRLRREDLRLPAEGRLPLPGQGRPPVRRQQGPGEGERGLVPVHPEEHRERQGPGLAQRPGDVPQPRRFHLRRRVRRVRRLLRAGRPVDRAARSRLRHGGDLREVGPRLRHRRLPDRHRQTRRPGLLDPVGDRPGHLRGQAWPQGLLHVRRGLLRRHRRHLALRHPGPARRDARLPVPGSGTPVRLPGRPGLEARRGVRRRLPLHHRQGQRLRAGDLPRQPRHGPHRGVPEAGQPEGRRRGARPARGARQRADVPGPGQPRRLLRRRAGLHRRGR